MESLGGTPIGIPTLEDKIVQRVTATVLQAVYEADFKGFSYGFRPARSPHNALDAVAVGLRQCKVNWRLPMKTRMRAKLREIKDALRQRLHHPVAKVG